MPRIEELLNPMSPHCDGGIMDSFAFGPELNGGIASLPGPSAVNSAMISSPPAPAQIVQPTIPSPTGAADRASNATERSIAHDPNHGQHPDCPNSLTCLEDTTGRPQYTYPIIMRSAILGSPNERLTIRDIYAAFEEKFPFFRGAGDTWKQSVRHYLSLSRTFERQPRPILDPGQGSYWTVNLNAPPGTKRPRKRGRPERALVPEEQNPRKRGRPRKDRDDMPPPPAPGANGAGLGDDTLLDGALPQMPALRSWSMRSPARTSTPLSMPPPPRRVEPPSTSSPSGSRTLPPLRAVSVSFDREGYDDSDEDLDEVLPGMNFTSPTPSDGSLSVPSFGYSSTQALDTPLTASSSQDLSAERLRAELEELRQRSEAEKQSLLQQLAAAQAHAQLAEFQLRRGDRPLMPMGPKMFQWQMNEYPHPPP